MNTLQLCDSFEPYYAGKKSLYASPTGPRAKAEPKPEDVSDPSKVAGKPKAVPNEKR
jgi:hypothetical protein